MARHTLSLEKRDIVSAMNGLLQGCPRFYDVAEMLKEWSKREWGPLLFGGFVRDLVLHGEYANPRDVDIVFTESSACEIIAISQFKNCERNRFGGLRMQTAGWKVDAWELDTTWAFKNQAFQTCVENLPRTTFLNIEAIVLQFDNYGYVVDVFDSGFLESIRSGLLDINLEQNPYPALAAVRALVMARKLEYGFSERLADYVVRQCTNRGIDQLILAQQQHYGNMFFDQTDLINLAMSINAQLESGETTFGPWHGMVANR